MAISFPGWFAAECKRRKTKSRAWLVRESKCSYLTVRKALSGEYVGPDAALRLSDATGGVVPPEALICLERRPPSRRQIA